MRIARYLVAGVDVWLNNPRRPLEASGTSGMKAAMNGVVNVSVLDGWWDEGWTGDNGWAIGGRETNPDEGAQDWADAQDLYRILEEEIVPRYYDRDAHGLPAAWVDLMRRSMASTLWRFSTTRMLHDYVEKMYLPNAAEPPAAMSSTACRPGRPSAAARPRPGRPGADQDSTAGAVDFLITSRVARRWAASTGAPDSPASSSRTAASPLPRMGWWTVVSGGSVDSARSMSSKPTTLTSAGTERPRSRSARIAPIAIASLIARIAVGRRPASQARSNAADAAGDTWPG